MTTKDEVKTLWKLCFNDCLLQSFLPFFRLIEKHMEAGNFEQSSGSLRINVHKRVKHPVIGEGNINTPQKLKRVMEIGVYSVVIGSAITRPQLITKKFTDALKE